MLPPIKRRHEAAPIELCFLERLLKRLFLHYRIPQEASARIHSQYREALQHYPEDLICAAYQHIVQNHALTTLPKPEAFLAFMQPEYQRRAYATALIPQD